MYAADVKDRKLTFVVSGMLWNRSLIMLDQETESQWSQLLGRCMAGPLKGTELTIIPSVITDWKTWYRYHPQTTSLMMSPTPLKFERDVHQEHEQFVIAIAEGDRARAWPFTDLQKTPLVNDQFQDQPLVLWFDKPSGGAWAWQRRVEGRLLDFELSGQQIVDRQTGSQWDLVAGRALAGPMKDTQLVPLPVIPSFKSKWKQFHPESEFWSAATER